MAEIIDLSLFRAMRSKNKEDFEPLCLELCRRIKKDPEAALKERDQAGEEGLMFFLAGVIVEDQRFLGAASLADFYDRISEADRRMIQELRELLPRYEQFVADNFPDQV